MSTHTVATVAVRRLLALSVAPPTPETIDEARDLAGGLTEIPGAPPALAHLADALDGVAVDELSIEFERLFDGEVLLPPYEGSYEVDPFRQGRQMADVAGFYAAFGASAHGLAAERPDHAGTELEFLSYLGSLRCEAEAEDDRDGVERCQEIEDRFLRDHAGRWLPTFFARLAEEAAHPVYRAIGHVGRDALTAELTARGIVPEPMPTDRGPRSAVEDDELTCAAGDDPAIAILPAGGHRTGER